MLRHISLTTIQHTSQRVVDVSDLINILEYSSFLVSFIRFMFQIVETFKKLKN